MLKTSIVSLIKTSKVSDYVHKKMSTTRGIDKKHSIIMDNALLTMSRS